MDREEQVALDEFSKLEAKLKQKEEKNDSPYVVIPLSLDPCTHISCRIAQYMSI